MSKLYRLLKVFDFGQVPAELVEDIRDRFDGTYLMLHTIGRGDTHNDRMLDTWLIEQGCYDGDSVIFEYGSG